jgi:predicted ester cyclase
MSEEMKAKIKRVWEAAFNQGRLDGLDEVLAPNYVRHKPPFPDVSSREAYKNFITDTRASYPDVQLTIDQLIIEGDWSAVLWTFAGTQTGVSPTTGAQPTNKYIRFSGCGMSRWEGGRAVEEWEHGDYLGLLQQLGVVPKLG